MSRVLAEYSSNSKRGVKYNIVEGDDGIVYCTCWQWKKTRRCHHLEHFEGHVMGVVFGQTTGQTTEIETAVQRAIEELT
jgi:hypothetical protein